MYRIVFLLVLSFLIPKSVLAQENTIEIQIDKKQVKALTVSELELGQQRFIKSYGEQVDIGLGNANSLLLNVVDFDSDSLYFDVKSFVVRHKIYYPIILKLTEEFDIQEIIQSEIELQGADMFGMSIDHHIGVDSTTKYILITTDPELLSDKYLFEQERVNSGIINADGTISPTYSETIVEEREIAFTDNPKVKVLLPFKNGKPIYKRESGFYFGMGFYIGGEKVEEANEEQYFRAGVGAVIPIGYSHTFGASNFVGRYGLAFRFQSGDENNTYNLGLLTDASVTYQTKYINFGLGLQYDFANRIKAHVKNYNFKPAFSPKVLLEGRLSGYMNIGVEYVLTNFETKAGQKFHGNRLGVMIRIFLGK